MARKRVTKIKTEKRTTYFIGNHTMGDILIMRNTPGVFSRTRTMPLIFPAGQSIPVDAVEWEYWKKNNAMIPVYLDHELLKEENGPGAITILTKKTSNPIVPDLLKDIDKVEGESMVAERAHVKVGQTSIEAPSPKG